MPLRKNNIYWSAFSWVVIKHLSVPFKCTIMYYKIYHKWIKETNNPNYLEISVNLSVKAGGTREFLPFPLDVYWAPYSFCLFYYSSLKQS